MDRGDDALFESKEEKIAKKAEREKRREQRRQAAQERQEERERVKKEKAAERARIAREEAAQARKRERERIDQELRELKAEREYYNNLTEKELLIEIALLLKGHMTFVSDLRDEIEDVKEEISSLWNAMPSDDYDDSELTEIKRAIDEIKTEMMYKY